MCPEDETHLDYKVTYELLFATFFIAMTSVFLLTSAFLSAKSAKSGPHGTSRDLHGNGDKKWTSYRGKMVDPSYESPCNVLIEEWGLVDPYWIFFADVSTFFATKVEMTSRDVTWRHHVGFSKKIQKVFLFMVSCFRPNMKSFASFKRKLWQF